MACCAASAVSSPGRCATARCRSQARTAGPGSLAGVDAVRPAHGRRGPRRPSPRSLSVCATPSTSTVAPTAQRDATRASALRRAGAPPRPPAIRRTAAPRAGCPTTAPSPAACRHRARAGCSGARPRRRTNAMAGAGADGGAEGAGVAAASCGGATTGRAGRAGRAGGSGVSGSASCMGVGIRSGAREPGVTHGDQVGVHAGIAPQPVAVRDVMQPVACHQAAARAPSTRRPTPPWVMKLVPVVPARNRVRWSRARRRPPPRRDTARPRGARFQRHCSGARPTPRARPDDHSANTGVTSTAHSKRPRAQPGPRRSVSTRPHDNVGMA